MRPKTLRKIDELHAQIEDLIQQEKRYRDAMMQDESDLWRGVAHARIEIARYCPMHRALRGESTATRRGVEP